MQTVRCFRIRVAIMVLALLVAGAALAQTNHSPVALSEDGDFPADIEIRYSLGRGESGVYTYSIFEHLPAERAWQESEKWPYDWVAADGYASAAERGHVSGRLVLDDPHLDSFPGRILVGLAQAGYDVSPPGFAHVPHAVSEDSREGRATPYTISFDLDQAPAGTAVLRLALSGTGTPGLEVDVNGRTAGRVPEGRLTAGVVYDYLRLELATRQGRYDLM